MDKNEYLAEIERFSEYENRYKTVLASCYQETKNKVVRLEYAVGGIDLYRGYYCPSIIEDIVVGNVSRGKILKCITEKKKSSFVFGFDSDDNLIMLKGYFKEIVFRKDNRELGIEFKKGYRIKSINECIYENGRIKSITRVFFENVSRRKNEVQKYEKEVYCYSDDRLIVEKFICQKFFCLSDWKIQQTKYNFSVKDGYLKNYTIQESLDCKEYGPESHTYKVCIKRAMNKRNA